MNAKSLKCEPVTNAPTTTNNLPTYSTPQNPTGSTPKFPCQPPSTGCGRGVFWNFKTCKCQVGCDWIEECPVAGETWDLFECGCIEACPGVTCDDGTILDVDTCQCIIAE